MSRTPAAADAASVAGGGVGSGSTSSPAPILIDPDLRKCLAEVNSMLATHVAAWMRKRGKSLRPKLSDEQRKQLEECFELMDADGSGAIDADELGAAFKLLGLDVSKCEIGQMLDEVDEDGSGEVEYPEFIEIMTTTLSKLAHKKEEQGSAGNQVPFALLATAYRRKRIMEGLISGDREVMQQVTSIAEHAAQRAAEEAQQQQKLLQQQARQHTSHLSNQPSSVSSPSGSGGGGRSSIFRSPVTSSTGSVEAGSTHSSEVAGLAAAAAAAGDARASQVASQAHIPSGLLRALQHVKSFRSSSSSSSLSSPSGSHAGGTLATPAAAGGAAASSASGAAWGSVQAEEAAWALPAEAVAGVLDLEEQRQLVSLLRAKTRKRLESIAAAAAAAGKHGAASLSPSRWPTATGAGCSAAGRSSSGAGGGNGNCGTASQADAAAAGAADGGARAGGCAGAGVGSGLGSCGDLEGLVGANQRMTSTRMLKLLTQDVQPPRFALSGPTERSLAGSSPSPTRGCSSRSGFKSASASPLPGRQPSAASVGAAAAAAVNRDSSSSRPSPQAAAAAGAAGDGSECSGNAPGGFGGALRKGINFGDTQIYEYHSGAGTSNSRSGSRTRGSNSSGGSSPQPMSRSRSLGALPLGVAGATSGAAVAAAAAGMLRAGSGSSNPGLDRAPSSRSPSRAPSSKGISSSGCCVEGCQSGDGSRKSPSRAASVHRRAPSVTSAALQQLGLACGPVGAPCVPGQLQQQWLAVPQLPRMGGGVPVASSSQHKRSKSGSPAVGAGSLPGSGFMLGLP